MNKFRVATAILILIVTYTIFQVGASTAEHGLLRLIDETKPDRDFILGVGLAICFGLALGAIGIYGLFKGWVMFWKALDEADKAGA